MYSTWLGLSYRLHKEPGLYLQWYKDEMSQTEQQNNLSKDPASFELRLGFFIPRSQITFNQGCFNLCCMSNLLWNRLTSGNKKMWGQKAATNTWRIVKNIFFLPDLIVFPFQASHESVFSACHLMSISQLDAFFWQLFLCANTVQLLTMLVEGLRLLCTALWDFLLPLRNCSTFLSFHMSNFNVIIYI